jgi:hypothetical protein
MSNVKAEAENNDEAQWPSQVWLYVGVIQGGQQAYIQHTCSTAEESSRNGGGA